MESSLYVVDRLRAFEYQQLLRDAAQQRLASGIQRSAPAASRWVRPAPGGVIAWLRGQTFAIRSRQQRACPVVGG